MRRRVPWRAPQTMQPCDPGRGPPDSRGGASPRQARGTAAATSRRATIGKGGDCAAQAPDSSKLHQRAAAPSSAADTAEDRKPATFVAAPRRVRALPDGDQRNSRGGTVRVRQAHRRRPCRRTTVLAEPPRSPVRVRTSESVASIALTIAAAAFGLAEMLEHHGGRPDLPDRVRDSPCRRCPAPSRVPARTRRETCARD